MEQKLRIAYKLYSGYLLRLGYAARCGVGGMGTSCLDWTCCIMDVGVRLGELGELGESDRHTSTCVIEKIIQGTK